MLSTPIILLIYNRPELTRKVFEAIARVRPKKLIVIADGPKDSNEIIKCEQAREVIETVNWDCEVRTKFSEVNQGCKNAISTGLSWAFELYEEAIILEDDCLPHPSFFGFCDELLEKYRDDNRIMMISGDNFQFGQRRGERSYYFSRFPHVWGWATWRRAWNFYDLDMQVWPKLRETLWLFDILGDFEFANYWKKIFDSVYNGQIDTWDYQWVFSCWLQHGLSITPNVNLVSNIGFGVEATHTKAAENKLANLPSGNIGFPLSHPKYIIRDYYADLFTSRQIYKMENRDSGRLNLVFKKIGDMIQNYRRKKDIHSLNRWT